MRLWTGRRRRFRRRAAAFSWQALRSPVLLRLDERCLPSAGYAQINLASDVPGLARVTDPLMANPWGIAHSPTGPFWFAENGTGITDILDGRGQPFSLVATVPDTGQSVGSPTGTVFNGGPGFVISENGVSAPSRFLFATEDGTIAGWTSVVDPARALLVVDNSADGAVYKGLSLATDAAGQQLLYAADFHGNRIDVFDRDFEPIVHAGSFHDPALPEGYAPFNIQNINGALFVTYAVQDASGHDSADGVGHGIIDIYDTDGNFVRRFASQGALDSPWGLALAPSNFGPFGGALLVGNTGDGHVNAYDPTSGAFLGQLTDDHGPITIPNLWSLTFGNGHLAGAADTLFFTAGLDDEAHGLFGAIQAPLRKVADTGGSGAFDPHAPGEPGDYPLPPRGGTTFRDQDGGPQFATAAMLPLSESSLVLIPTLSFSSPDGTRQGARWADFATPFTAGAWAGEPHKLESAIDGRGLGRLDPGTSPESDLAEFETRQVDLPDSRGADSFHRPTWDESVLTLSLIDDRMARSRVHQSADSTQPSAFGDMTLARVLLDSSLEQTCNPAVRIEPANIDDRTCRVDVLVNLLPAISVIVSYVIWEKPGVVRASRATASIGWF